MGLDYGYTPETISKITAPYDPSGNENYLTRIFASSVSKPKPIDERKIQNAKLLGTIGDAGLVSITLSPLSIQFLKLEQERISILKI